MRFCLRTGKAGRGDQLAKGDIAPKSPNPPLAAEGKHEQLFALLGVFPGVTSPTAGLSLAGDGHERRKLEGEAKGQAELEEDEGDEFVGTGRKSIERFSLFSEEKSEKDRTRRSAETCLFTKGFRIISGEQGTNRGASEGEEKGTAKDVGMLLASFPGEGRGAGVLISI